MIFTALTQRCHAEKCRLGIIAEALREGDTGWAQACRHGVIRDRAQLGTGDPMAVHSSVVVS